MIRGRLEIRWTENPPTTRTMSIATPDVSIQDAEFVFVLLEKLGVIGK